MLPKPKLYGVPLSQSFRSVAWAMLQKQIAFDFRRVVPGITNKTGSLHPDFLSKTYSRSHRLPVYEEQGGGLTISESPAILTYLCESRGWRDWYPPFSDETAITKTRIDSYVHWHPSGTQPLKLLTRPLLRPDLHLPKASANDEQAARRVLNQLETGWLNSSKIGGGSFIAGTEDPTIADLLAYEEVAQAMVLGGLQLTEREYPNLKAWTEKMQRLPYHDAAHAALYTLSDIIEQTKSTRTTLSHLAMAQKEGFKAIQQAQ